MAKQYFKQKPRLPAEYTEKRAIEFAIYVGRMCLMWLIPALVVAWLYQADLALVIKIPLFIILGWLGGFGMACGQWIGHDACHDAFDTNRKRGMMIGNFFAASTPFFINTGFTANHLDHHRYVNTLRDGDVHYYTQYNSLPGRLFFVRISKNRAYIKAAFHMWRDRSRLAGFSAEDTRQILFWNLVFSMAWLGFYTWLAFNWFGLFLGLAVLPTLALIIGTGCITYQQHAGTEANAPDDYWRNARSLTNRFWTSLYTGGNFHLEHHLYPSVPVWKLPKVHRFLKQNGYLDQPGMHLDNGTVTGYKYFSPGYRYPQPADLESSA